jgi:Ca2+-transporting ATPase
VTRVALDKTGTLTTGEMKVRAVEAVDGAVDALLRGAAGLGVQSLHPVSVAIVREARRRGFQIPEVQDFSSSTGGGLKGKTESGDESRLGRRTFFDGAPWVDSLPAPKPGVTEVFFGAGSLRGRILLEDEIRQSSRPLLEWLVAQGLKVTMLTGDREAAARLVAEQVGLKEYRFGLHPEDKVEAIREWSRQGDKVAMVGDGVNDAPALKAAHIGVAMGAKGTDVAREAASLVLLDDNFASIVAAIRSGRRIFDNLQKAMSYILAIHIPIIALTLIPAFMGELPVLLFPIHIVFMELIIDPVCSIAFESEQEESGIMQRPPRPANEQFFGRKKIIFAIFKGLMLLITVLVVFGLSIQEGHSEGEVRAIVFSTLIIGNIFLILTDLSHTRSFLSVFMERSKATLLIVGIALTLLFSTLTIPGLNFIFNFEFPGFGHFLPAIAAAGTMLLVLEGHKWWVNRV